MPERLPSSVNSLSGVGIEAIRLEPGMLRLEIVHGQRQVTVAVTEGIRLGSAVIDRQLQLELALLIAQVEKREAVEGQTLGHLEAERLLVEGK